MKFAFSFFLLLMASISYSQENYIPTPNDTTISYSDVILESGVNKAELFIRARDWCANYLQGIKIQDKATGEIFGYSKAVDTTKGFLWSGTRDVISTFGFQVHIWVKDGRCLYLISNINNISNISANPTARVAELNSGDIPYFLGPLLLRQNHDKISGFNQEKLNKNYELIKATFDKIAASFAISLSQNLAVSSTPNF